MAFDPNQPFTIVEEEDVGFDPTKPFSIEQEPSGTSFGKEVSQLGSAFVESIGRPLENMGESFESFGFNGVANALKGAITEPENYVSAGQRFIEPAPDEAQFMGFAWQYAPRAAVEQVGQVIGAIGTRAVGAAAGGAVAGPPGAIAGGFVGPAIFGAAQVIGPVAKERAMNNGREVPNNEDLVAATLTAIGSGSLDAIGARYLPGGDKATGKFFKRVASSFVGEGVLTETPQSFIEQIGSTAGTEKGLNINVKQAVGEGLIGGTSAAGLTAIVSPFSKPAENQVIRTPEQAEEFDIDSKANQEAILLMGDPADQTQNERITKLKEIESVIANNETLMSGLEPNAPERTKLDLENRVAIKEAERLKSEIKQSVGLSEPITTIEEQQAELAKAITTPEAAPAPAPVEQVVTPPVEVAPAPAIEEEPMPVSDEKEFAELNDLMEKKGQAENKVRGVKFTKQNQSRYQNLLTKFRDRLIETTDPKNDPVVGTDINGTPIQQSNKGTFYTFENGRVRTGPAFSESTPAPTIAEAAPVEPTTPAPVTEQAAPAEAPAPEVAPVAGDIQVANKPKAQQTISATFEAISKKEPLPQTRGKGTQYHGARGPIENLVEAYYSPDNIYGGEGTFYTTDALDIAAGYQRKKQSGVIYRVDEVTPVNFFNMEDRKPKTEWLSMFEGQGDFIEFAVEGIYNDNPNLREIMDEMRAESANEGLTKDDVQEIFGSITYNLQQQGYGGMTHIGGLKTNREPHAVKIYFDPTNQISLSLEDVTKPSQKPTPAVSETITPAEEQGGILKETAKFADEALRERDKEVARYKKKADAERKAGREEMAQIYEGMIDDLMSVPANEFKQDVIENPAYYIESNVDPFLRFKNKGVNRAAPAQPEGIAVGNRIRLGRSPQTYTIEEVISQSETEKANGEQYYSVKNEKTGETQVVEKADMKPVKKSADTRKTVIGDTQYQTEGVIPEDQRFTEDELRVIVNDIFGGKIPDKIKIITDTTDPNKEFKAAYSIRKGTITYNLAYLAKGDDLNFVTNHELGHYILGDPKFQGEMARLFDSLPADIQEKLKKAIDEAYAQEGLGVRAEETIVFAFGEILENAPDGRNILQRFLDAIRDAINRLFKTEGYIPRNPKKAAAAILMAARNRFERGEFIKRPNGSILMMTPTSTKDLMRDAEYLAAVERGDMETAQRMVDEAAKAAGYNIGPVFHKTLGDFNVFDLSKASKSSVWGPAIYASFDGDWNPASLSGGRTIKGFVGGRVLDMTKPLNENDQKILSDLLGRKIGESMPLFSLERRFGSVAEGLKKAGYSAAIHFGPGSRGLHIAVFNPNQIKSADPVTYDDAGNVIPLSQRFQPSEPDIRRMAVRKEQIMGEKVGPEVKTPEGIIAKTQELLRKQFDPTKVSEKNTTDAFRALGRLTGRGGTDFAKELNDIGRVVDESGAASEISMGAALFINDLFEYSIRLAAEGNKKLLGMMLTNINKLPTAAIGVSDAARDLRARLEIAQRFRIMGDAEQDAFANYVAEFIYGPNPSKDQIQSIKDASAAVEKTPQVTEQELTDEIAAVGDRAGTDLVGKINEEFTKATEKGKEKRRTEEQELDREYKKVQRQADAEIEKLAKIQSDTPSFDPAAARQITNDVRAIVATDLKQRPDMGRKAPWKSMLVAKLQEAGVELTAAETLADIVWRQHEINNLSRELSSINKAIEKGPISEIVKAIKDTPLEEQQKPNWRYEVMRDYLRKAGLNVAQSERIAKLMDISLQKRFTMAQEEAFTQAISKSAPWKNGDTRSRRAFQKVLQALRAGALDPTRNVLSDMAALNGWTGFTPEQYKALLKYDAILANPETKQADLAEAHKAIQNIISKAKLPIRARDVIGQYYDAQALSGITTMTVNIFSPAGVAAKNALVQSLNGLVTARPEQITAAMTTFVDSIKSWANTVAYSFKNNVTVYSNVEYLVNDEGLLKLYNRGVDQFNNGKTPRERADGVKNMMIGMMDYVRRVLNALDYGAIASLQNQAVSKYALAAMQAKGMSSKDGAKMLNAMMEQKRIFYNDQIAIGTDKNKAAVLADEFFISAWRQALTDARLPAQEVIDAALNDAMSAVGRNRQSLDAFLEEETNTRDQGLLSFPAIWLLETMANAANKQDSQFIKIFSRIIYGFAIVPARVLREAAWFSPIGAYRFAYEYIAEKKGLKSRYAQSLGNDLQYRQRLTETIAGSIVMLAFGAAMSASTDDEEDKKPFKIVITGNGPLRNQDPQFHDSWVKKNRANTVNVYFGKTKFTINTMRGFEAFAWPAMMLGAVDDWHIRRKQGRTTNTPLQMQDGAIVAGNILSASLRRGPYAFAAKPLFEAYGDRGVESLAKSLAFPAKTLVPVLGSSLAKNISDFLNEPMDRRTLEGALWSNVPFIGPTIAPKSLNAFGEPALASDSADKIFKLGVPIVYDIPNDRNSIMVHELVLKQGGGPSIPNRSQVAKRLDREPTNKEFEMFVKEYGAEIKRVMSENIEELSAMDGPDYDRAMEYIGNNARDMAQAKLMESK
jgi:hypothetical protein